MSDLIDRQAAIDAIKREQAYYAPEDGAEIFYEYNQAIKALKNLPSAQTDPKKGKWIEHNPHRWGLGIVFECSECGEEIECESSNFCPNCGADMRGADRCEGCKYSGRQWDEEPCDSCTGANNHYEARGEEE